MFKYAEFDTEKEATDFIKAIDNAFGFPNAEATTYAIPEQSKSGKWVVKLKPWLLEDVGQSRKWFKSVATNECKKLSAQKLLDTKPALASEA